VIYFHEQGEQAWWVLKSYSSRSASVGVDSLAMKSLFQQEMIKRGILIAGGFNLCYAHSDDDVHRTLGACREALTVLARAVAEDRVDASLEGPVIQPVFRSA
jgi:glutamate-1-semialdehyde 2,1-aminomutase